MFTSRSEGKRQQNGYRRRFLLSHDHQRDEMSINCVLYENEWERLICSEADQRLINMSNWNLITIIVVVWSRITGSLGPQPSIQIYDIRRRSTKGIFIVASEIQIYLNSRKVSQLIELQMMVTDEMMMTRCLSWFCDYEIKCCSGATIKSRTPLINLCNATCFTS